MFQSEEAATDAALIRRIRKAQSGDTADVKAWSGYSPAQKRVVIVKLQSSIRKLTAAASSLLEEQRLSMRCDHRKETSQPLILF